MIGSACSGRLGKIAILCAMALRSTLLASGSGWAVNDVLCTACPSDCSGVEQHRAVCIALVTGGNFQYRGAHGAALMVPGTTLLGNAGECFECSHEHSRGDRCLSFNFTPGFYESVVAAVPGARRSAFGASRLPPLPTLLPIAAAAQVARDLGAEALEFEELALQLAGAVCRVLEDSQGASRVPTRRDERRIAALVGRLEERAEERAAARVSVVELARETALSPFHFLRLFERIVGVTPGQYMLRRRLHRAAMQLRRSSEGVASIAAACGFDDLSTFNRHFRRTAGVTPSVYRAQRRCGNG